MAYFEAKLKSSGDKASLVLELNHVDEKYGDQYPSRRY
jgi:hypothetical protein